MSCDSELELHSFRVMFFNGYKNHINKDFFSDNQVLETRPLC